MATITKIGLQLLAETNQSGSKLTFTRLAAGTGNDSGADYSDLTALQQEYVDLVGLNYTPPSLDSSGQGYSFSISAYMDNTQLNNEVKITEVGIFAEAADGSEILFAIDARYEQPVVVYPAQVLPGLQGFQQVKFIEYIEINKDLQIDLTLIADGNITIEFADGRYWRLGKKYPATEITESNGSTTEAHQRWQDEQLEQLKKLLESGSTAGTMVDRPVLDVSPYHWKILNHSGYRDSVTNSIRA